MASNSINNGISSIKTRVSIAPLRGLGFTLIELTIVVAVIAILSTMAYPSYQEQLHKARRADAQGALQAFAIAMERYFTEQASPTYIGANRDPSDTTIPYTIPSTGSQDTPHPTVFSEYAPLDGAIKYYNLTVAVTHSTATTPESYQLLATPTNAQAGDKCGTYTLQSTGTRGITDAPTEDVSWRDCWG